MPNWSQAKTTISGPKETMNEIHNKIKEDGMNWKNTPMYVNPEDPNWYALRIEKWGTKWDMWSRYKEAATNGCESDISWNPEGYLYIAMEYPWSAPTNFFTWLSSNYPDITIEHEEVEPGVGFIGSMTCLNGYCSKHTADILSQEAIDILGPNQWATEVYGYRIYPSETQYNSIMRLLTDNNVMYSVDPKTKAIVIDS